MGRQARAKKPEQFGKGKVTPVQIAYIVDQYLSENHFTQTRTSFRSEASSLISRTPLQEGPKGLMSLGAIIEEYLSMKEEKLLVEMDRQRMEQDRFRVQSLLQGMQNVMNAYNASSTAVSAGLHTLPTLPPAGQMVSVFNTMGASKVPNASRGLTSVTSQMGANTSSRKRQASRMATNAPTNAKKSCARTPIEQSSHGNSLQSTLQPAALQPSTSGRMDDMSPVQEPNVAKLAYHQTTSTTTAMQKSPGPVIPQQGLSTQSDKNVSPVGHSSSTNSSHKNTPPEFASNCTIVSTKTVIVSPYKQAAYYSVEKHCSSTCSPAKSDLQRSMKRDRVKGRLNFDGADETTSLEKLTANESSNSESDDGNCFDLDLPVLDFDIADLLMDFGIYREDLNASHRQVILSSPAKCTNSIQENTALWSKT